MVVSKIKSLFILGFLSLFQSIDASEKNMPCALKGCVTVANEMLKRMDLDSDPCTDFFNYTCGRFIKSNSCNSKRMSEIDLKKAETTEFMTIILSSPAEHDSIKPRRDLRKFYKACHSKDYSTSVQKANLIEVMTSLNIAPLQFRVDINEEHWIERTIGKLLRMGSASLFSVEAKPDFNSDPFGRILSIDHKKFHSMLYNGEDKFYENDLIAILIKLYGTFLSSIPSSDFTISSVIPSNRNTFINNIIGFEKAVHDVVEQSGESMVVGTLGDLFARSSNFETNFFNWEVLFNIILEGTSVAVDSQLKIEYNAVFVRKMEELFSSTNEKTIAGALGALMLKSFVGEILPATDIASLSNPETFTENALLTKLSCYEKADLLMNHITASEFNRHQQKSLQEIHSHVNVEFDYLKQYFFLFVLPRSNTFDENEKQLIKNRLLKLKQIIGCESWVFDDDALEKYYKQLKISDESHVKNILHLNEFIHKKKFAEITGDIHEYNFFSTAIMAEAEPSKIAFTVPLSMLNPPFYYHLSFAYLRYGSLQAIMAAEIFRKIQAMDIEYSSATISKIDQVKQCLRELYYQLDIEVSDASLNRLIGEHAAVSLVQNASKLLGGSSYIHGLGIREAKQMFWIAYGRQMCENNEQNPNLSYLTNRDRVRSVIANNPLFQQDFQCQPKTTRTKTCSLL